MSEKNQDRTIVVKKKSYPLNELAKKLSGFSSERVKQFFNHIGLTIPKTLRIHVLKLVLEPYVLKTVVERESLADELGYRLSWFSRFSEYQLENLLKFYNDPNLTTQYLETLWVYLIDYLLDKKVDENDFKNFIETKEKVEEDILVYNLNLKSIFYDEQGNIDGLEPNVFRPVLYKSSTLTEIREIGKKYGVDVPRRLKKNELANIIVEELKDRGEYTEELDMQVRSLSIITMQRFAKDRDIKASTELKKEEIIEYILANAKETKEAYFLPSDKSIYEQELVEPKKKPEIEEIKVVEEEKPVVEEEPISEPKKEEPTKPVIPSKLHQALLEEIKNLNSEVKRLQGEINEIKEMEIVIDEPFDEEEDGYDEMIYHHHHEHHHYHHYDEMPNIGPRKEASSATIEEKAETEEKQPKKKSKKKRALWVTFDIVLLLVLVTLVYLMLVQFDIIQPLFPLPF